MSKMIWWSVLYIFVCVVLVFTEGCCSYTPDENVYVAMLGGDTRTLANTNNVFATTLKLFKEKKYVVESIRMSKTELSFTFYKEVKGTFRLVFNEASFDQYDSDGILASFCWEINDTSPEIAKRATHDMEEIINGVEKKHRFKWQWEQ